MLLRINTDWVMKVICATKTTMLAFNQFAELFFGGTY